MANYKAGPNSRHINMCRFYIARYFDTMQKFCLFKLEDAEKEELAAFLFAHMVLLSVIKEQELVKSNDMYNIGSLCVDRIDKLSTKLPPAMVVEFKALATYEFATRLYDQERLEGHTCAYMRNRRTMQLIKNKELDANRVKR